MSSRAKSRDLVYTAGPAKEWRFLDSASLHSEWQENIKTQWNNPWLSASLWFAVCQGLFRWVLGFYHWLTSLSAVCDVAFHLVIASVNNIELITSFAFPMRLAFYYALILFGTEGWKAASFLGGDLPVHWYHLFCSCPGFVWCLPLCDYNITQLFALCKMAEFTNYASSAYATCIK